MILLRVTCSDPSEPGKVWHQLFEDLYLAQKYADAMRRHYEHVRITIIKFQEVERIET